MEVFEKALHDEVIAKGGTELAKSMGVNRTRLLDCANPNREDHRMNLQMFGQILAHLDYAAKRRVLCALVGEFGFDLVDKDAAKAMTLTAALVGVGKEVAELTLAIHEAMADNHVNQTEKSIIGRAVSEVRGSLDVVEQSVKRA
ncbi:hypothetical protein SAMN05216201_11149 [Pseudomonas linyingensis]|uniref:Phage regulatory protein CII (CP76) n=1 Tax=Pseudomonas linyingensis TaxID=915471 RepID=A0A1H6ZZ04_9PSED|nr:phage regulatory CII family protein [Pseudomonas linyingensis]SEJ57424.1 hypothetical protein SAMN05216201_11149 [Pseudomonas linyingensis]